MTGLPDGLEEAWQYLSASAGSRELIPSRATGVNASSGVVRVALEPSGVRHLLVPVPHRGDVVVDRRSRGVVVVPQELEISGERRWFADLVCVDRRLVDVYTRLAAVVCEAITADPQLAGTAPARVLDEWRELLSTRRSVLGRDAAIGLFGELQFLLEGVDVAGAGLFSSWSGPEGHQHDFAAGGVALEVKATTAREGRRVEIHGLEQLTVDPGSDLYLGFVRLAASPDGQTISDLVRQLSDRGVTYSDLLRRMKKVGYEPGEGVDETRLNVKDLDIYPVDSDFPAITRESFQRGLPGGIESVRYVVDLVAAGKPVDKIKEGEIFRSLVGG